MALPTQPYKGARDFYPEDERIQRYIFNVWARVAQRFGYERYDAPIIELTELFRAKSGEELVSEQTYTFMDRGGRDVTIRPEMTPSVARMVAGRRQELAYPLRWYSIPNLWRYERPQRGRLREHWQLNVDIFGIDTIDAEIELLQVASSIMQEFGAAEELYTIRINSRELTALVMSDFLELDATQSGMLMKLFDRKAKIPEETFNSEARQIFDGNDPNAGMKKLQLITSAKSMGDLPEKLRDSAPVKKVQALFTLLKENHIENAVFDVFLMRGFDYYTDIVFEFFDNNPENPRSLFGGGRYDGLVGLFGVEPIATVGFGVGDVTIKDFLETHQLLPELSSETAVYLAVLDTAVLRQAQGVASLLRNEGINVAVELSPRKIDKQIKAAVKKSIPFVLFVGEAELNSEKFPLKDLTSGEEQKLALKDVISLIKSRGLE